MTSLPRDANRITVVGGVSSSDGITPVAIYADPTTHRLYVNSSGGGGSMVYPGAGIAVSTGAAWASSISGTSSQFVKGDGSLDSTTPVFIDNYAGNGIKSGFVISINADPTKIDISAGTGNIIDNSNPAAPVVTLVNYAGATGIAVSYIATSNATYIAMDASGTIYQQTTEFTPTQRRTLLILGAAIHFNRTSVTIVNNLPDVALGVVEQYNDLLDALKNFNVSGNVFSANGANLNINKSAGVEFKKGSNFDNDPLNPHTLSLGALTPSSFSYRLQNGTDYGNTTTIDPTHYDNGGVLTSVGAGKWTVQRINIFSSNTVRIQYGQKVYNTSAAAITGIAQDAFVTEQNISDNGLLRCLLVINQASTDLTNGTAIFLVPDKFGGVQSATAGAPTTNMQQSYNNSFQPQILTNATAGAIQYQQGSGADTDAVFEILNGAGTATATILGNGALAVNSALATGVFSGSYTDGVVIDYNNPNGRIIVGASDTISFYNNGVTSPFKLGGFDASGNFSATGTISFGGFKVNTETAVTTIAINSDLYDEVYATCTASSGTLTVSADTGTHQYEKKDLWIKVNCTNTQTFSWTTGAGGFYGGLVSLPVSTTGGGKTDYYHFFWDSITSHWLFMGQGLGY
jgi:hypothetical protein